MRIEIKERGSKEFYDEFLFVTNNYGKIIQKPNKKATLYTSYLATWSCASLVVLAVFAVAYMFDKDFINIIFMVFFAVIAFLLFAFNIAVKNKIKVYLADDSEKYIDINDDNIVFNSESMSLSIKKESISMIVINKYSTCILPKVETTPIVSISNDYLSDFLKGAEENGYNDLIVNNKE